MIGEYLPKYASLNIMSKPHFFSILRSIFCWKAFFLLNTIFGYLLKVNNEIFFTVFLSARCLLCDTLVNLLLKYGFKCIFCYWYFVTFLENFTVKLSIDINSNERLIKINSNELFIEMNSNEMGMEFYSEVCSYLRKSHKIHCTLLV